MQLKAFPSHGVASPFRAHAQLVIDGETIAYGRLSSRGRWHPIITGYDLRRSIIFVTGSDNRRFLIASSSL